MTAHLMQRRVSFRDDVVSDVFAFVRNCRSLKPTLFYLEQDYRRFKKEALESNERKRRIRQPKQMHLINANYQRQMAQPVEVALSRTKNNDDDNDAEEMMLIVPQIDSLDSREDDDDMDTVRFNLHLLEKRLDLELKILEARSIHAKVQESYTRRLAMYENLQCQIEACVDGIEVL